MDRQVLMLAIIQREDRESANAALTQAGFQVTHISSMGGFLETGNATLLIGLEQRQISRALHLLTTNCHKRIAFANTTLEIPGVGLQYAVMPVEVQEGGGTIFVLPLERFIRLGAPDRKVLAESPLRKEPGMRLIMAIVPEEQSDGILQSLTAAQYRATRISTTGGFLRKGNGTLLIGVDANQVDKVLKEIEDTCTASAPDTAPARARAAIFVLNVEQYLDL